MLLLKSIQTLAMGPKVICLSCIFGVLQIQWSTQVSPGPNSASLWSAAQYSQSTQHLSPGSFSFPAVPPDAWLEYKVEMLGFEPVEEVGVAVWLPGEYALSTIANALKCLFDRPTHNMKYARAYILWVQ